MEEILAFTVVVELPRDLGIENAGVFAFDDAPHWDGWDETSIANLVRYPPPLDPGRTPAFRIVLRRTKVRSRLPLQAADKTFGEWAQPLRSRKHRLARRLRYRLAATIGLREAVSVAAVTAFLPIRNLPSDSGPTWVEHRVVLAVEVLNDFLISLGVESRDGRIGPVYRSDLPADLPIIAETQPIPTAKRQGGDWLAPLHQWRPVSQRHQRDPSEIERAAMLFRAAWEKSTPWFPVLDLLHTARRDAMAGRYATAVLNAGTSIEILLSTIVTSIGPLRGWPEHKVGGVLESGLKNIIRDHVPKALRVSIDLDDDSNPWGAWWSEGYLLRNAVAHRGARPTEAEAYAAVYAAMHLVAAVGRIVEHDPDLRHLEVGLPTGVEPDGR